jgi:hypothetical protein
MRSFALVFLTAAACSPYNPDLGLAPFLCGSDAPQCPDGYTCQSNSASGGGGSDTGSDGSGSSAPLTGGICIKMGETIPIDASPVMCADDHALEPNDTKEQAWATPVDQPNHKDFELASLAICPMGDKDTYSLTVSTPGENVEVLIEYETTGAALQGSILNDNFTAVAMAMSIQGSPGHLRAYLANAPTGVYYVQVFGPAQGTLTENNYNLAIHVTGGGS